MPPRKRHKQTKRIKVPCPRPDKRAYASIRDANDAKLDSHIRGWTDISVYLCQCGMYHLGSAQSLLTYKIRKALTDN